MRGSTAAYMVLALAALLSLPLTVLRRDLNGLRHAMNRQVKVAKDDTVGITALSTMTSRAVANETWTNMTNRQQAQSMDEPNNTTDHMSRPLLQIPSKATGRAFVCITGQVKRLVAEKIKETVLEPLQNQGYEVDVALAMSDDALHSTNSKESRWKWNPFTTYQQVHDYFSSAGLHVVTNASIVPLENPPVPPDYIKRMDKDYMSEEDQKNRVQNHARQFQTLTKCHDALIQQGISSSLDHSLTRSAREEAESVESTTRDYYDFSIRLREDVSFNETLDMNPILPLLYPNKGDEASINGTVLGTDCRAFGGINDRMAIVSRQAFHGYFHGPWDNFYVADDATMSESTLYKNPETYLKYVYRERLRIKVTKSKYIRGVIKYIVTNSGTAEEPRLVTKPAPGENVTYCPGDPMYTKQDTSNATTAAVAGTQDGRAQQ